MGVQGTNRTKLQTLRRGVAAMAALAILTTLTTGCASIRPRADIAHIGYAISAAADVHSTQQALATGADETNPLLGSNPSTAKVAALKTAGFLALRSLESSWERSLGRHLKWYEKILLWGVPIGLQTWAATHNAQVARR